MKKINRKKVVQLLIVILVFLLIGNIIFKYFTHKQNKGNIESSIMIEENKDEVNYDKQIAVENLEEYINKQKSNLDMWVKAYDKLKKSITEDLWSNKQAQKKYKETSKEFINASKLVKNLTWLEGGNTTEILFIQSMDYFIDEVNLRIEIFDLIEDNDPKVVAEKINKANEFNVEGMDLLIQAQDKFAKLEKENK